MTHLILLTGTIMQNTNIETIKNQNHEQASFVYTEVCSPENRVYQDQYHTKGELVASGDHPKGSRRDYLYVSADPSDAYSMAEQYSGKVHRRSIMIEGVKATLWICVLKGTPGMLDEVNND
jgi:ribosomal protein S10